MFRESLNVRPARPGRNGPIVRPNVDDRDIEGQDGYYKVGAAFGVERPGHASVWARRTLQCRGSSPLFQNTPKSLGFTLGAVCPPTSGAKALTCRPRSRLKQTPFWMATGTGRPRKPRGSA